MVTGTGPFPAWLRPLSRAQENLAIFPRIFGVLKDVDIAKEDCHSLAATDAQTDNTECLRLVKLDQAVV